MSAWSDIERPHDHLKSLRQREETTWRDLARLLRPDGQNFSAAEKRERNTLDDPFDSTPLYALDDFVQGTFTNAVNPAERWFEVAIDDEDLAQFAPVKQWQFAYANVIYASLHPGRDNFYLSAPAWFGDLGAFGTGFEWQEEIVGQRQIMSKNLPIGECYKDVDGNGVMERFHREFTLKGHQAKMKWRGVPGVSAFNDDKEIVFVHAIYPNPDFRPGALGSRGMYFRSCYASPDEKNFISEGGYNEMPAHDIEWNMRSGRAWATGPGHNALADMRANDEVARSALTAIQFDAEPMWWAQDEEVMTQADLQPSNILYGDAVSGGKPPMQLLERQKQMQLPLQLQNDLRNQIRKAFHFGLSQVLANRPQMTAQEVMAYKADELKQLAPNLVRIQRGLSSFIRRRAQLLQRMGMVPPPPPEVLQRGANLSIEFVSPFAKAQKADVAKGAIGWASAMIQLAKETGRPDVIDPIDFDGLSKITHDAMSGAPSIIKDPRDIATMRQNRSAMQAQQAQREQQDRQAAIVADVSHAQQASTLAKGRARP